MPQAFMRSSAQDRARMCSPLVFFSGLNPDGVAVDVVEYHLVLKTSAGDVWKLTCLIGV